MKLLVLSALAFVVLSPTFAGDRTVPAATRDGDSTKVATRFVDGMATIDEHATGRGFKVTVKTSKAADSLFKEGFRWGGEDTSAPPNLITSIVVQSGADKLFVPLSSYSDLGDPRRITLKPSATGFELAIAGGDAAVAFNATLVFEKGRLTRRRVAHGEFPDQAWEETRYAYNTLDN
ncbi:hypothetical protein [Stenotrophomonas rhizophila]|uniref:hypothetical protein n=1 Tax=Stenotrophomonas rhizophila TaxID=216778 RepID=UPI001E311505|nr:hypothetical protein [Stenotrophomonas rhizophila]MCC7634430.1 hypothetical protein [Stenotrophomonas rhizophila]MCC7663828.1 hypothetical protein [Stenotrophomonas rhizophila]